MNNLPLKEDYLQDFGLGVINKLLDSSFHLSLKYDCEGNLDGEN